MPGQSSICRHLSTTRQTNSPGTGQKPAKTTTLAFSLPWTSESSPHFSSYSFLCSPFSLFHSFRGRNATMILSSPLALSRHIFHYYYFIQLQHSLLELGSLLCTADTCFKTCKLALETFQNTAMLTTLLCLVTHFSRRADTRGLCLCHIRSPQTFIVNSTLDFV